MVRERCLQCKGNIFLRLIPFAQHLSLERKDQGMKRHSIAAATLILCCFGATLSAQQLWHLSLNKTKQATEPQESGQVPADVKEKIQALGSGNAVERASATCALGEMGAHASAAIPALINLLADAAQLDQNVCDRHGSWKGKENSKTSVGEFAAVALAKIGKPSVEPLIAALKNGDALTRTNATFALGLVRDERGVEPLIAALTDTEVKVRRQAAWSLGLQRDQRAIEPLIVALKDTDADVRSQAAWSLGLEGDSRSVLPLVAALKDESERVQSQAAWALGLKGDERAVEPLTIALQASGEQVRSQAAWALGLKGDDRAVQPLIVALKDSNAEVRAQAAWALGLKGNDSAVEPLKSALNDTDEHVRKQAAWALNLRGLKSGRRQGMNTEMNMNVNVNVDVAPKVN
jgi:HEAT repeat protein